MLHDNIYTCLSNHLHVIAPLLKGITSSHTIVHVMQAIGWQWTSNTGNSRNFPDSPQHGVHQIMNACVYITLQSHIFTYCLCMQWVNGVQIVTHSGGHLPFEANITSLVMHGAPNRITVAVNNTLTPNTLPPGTLTFGGPPNLPEGFVELNYQFDFYNYAGVQDMYSCVCCAHACMYTYTCMCTMHVYMYMRFDYSMVIMLERHVVISLKYFPFSPSFFI